MYDLDAWRTHDAGARALQIAGDTGAGFAIIAGRPRAFPFVETAPAPDWRIERAQAFDAIRAKSATDEMEGKARPFRFEDLNGKPEPERWGPIYPKTASANVEKWRKLEHARELTADEVRAYGRAVHEWIRGLNKSDGAPRAQVSLKSTQFNAARHRAKLITALHATAAAERRAWAHGQATDSHGRTIVDVYKAAMRAKRARLGLPELAEAA